MIDGWGWPARIGAMALLVVVYSLLYAVGHPIAGRTIGSLTVPLIACIALLGGHEAWGLGAAILLVPFNLWLVNSIGLDEPLASHIAYSLSGALFGWLALTATGWSRVMREQHNDLLEERTRLDTEISRREFVEASLQAERDFARLIIDSLGQGLVLMNSQFRFEYVNPAYAALIGRRPEDIAAIAAAQDVLRGAEESTTALCGGTRSENHLAVPNTDVSIKIERLRARRYSTKKRTSENPIRPGRSPRSVRRREGVGDRCGRTHRAGRPLPPTPGGRQCVIPTTTSRPNRSTRRMPALRRLLIAGCATTTGCRGCGGAIT